MSKCISFKFDILVYVGRLALTTVDFNLLWRLLSDS
jgi:hypothetical protein